MKTPGFFFQENPLGFFITVFSGVFIAISNFLFFTLTAFLLLFCQELRFAIVVPRVLRKGYTIYSKTF